MNWQRRLNRADAPSIPVSVTNAGYTYWITPRQYRLAVLAGSGPVKSTVRALAARTGQSTSQVQRTIAHLDALGILKRTTKRGRHGFTRFLLRIDAVARRVMSPPQEPRELLGKNEETHTSLVVGTLVPRGGDTPLGALL